MPAAAATSSTDEFAKPRSAKTRAAASSSFVRVSGSSLRRGGIGGIVGACAIPLGMLSIPTGRYVTWQGDISMRTLGRLAIDRPKAVLAGWMAVFGLLALLGLG